MARLSGEYASKLMSYVSNVSGGRSIFDYTNMEKTGGLVFSLAIDVDAPLESYTL